MNGVMRYIYEPGNGSRYCLLFGELAEGRYLLAWMFNGDSGGSVVTFGDGMLLSRYALSKSRQQEAERPAVSQLYPIGPSYLMEKMGVGPELGSTVNRTDANVLTGFLRMMGVDAWVDPGYSPLGLRENDTPRYSMENPPTPLDLS